MGAVDFGYNHVKSQISGGKQNILTPEQANNWNGEIATKLNTFAKMFGMSNICMVPCSFLFKIGDNPKYCCTNEEVRGALARHPLFAGVILKIRIPANLI